MLSRVRLHRPQQLRSRLLARNGEVCRHQRAETNSGDRLGFGCQLLAKPFRTSIIQKSTLPFIHGTTEMKLDAVATPKPHLEDVGARSPLTGASKTLAGQPIHSRQMRTNGQQSTLDKNKNSHSSAWVAFHKPRQGDRVVTQSSFS